MSGDLLCISVNAQSAPLALRERLRAKPGGPRAMLPGGFEIAAEHMVLTTCERFEVHALAPTISPAPWIDCIARQFAVPVAALGRHCWVFHGHNAARHLLRVSAGLESRVPGEPHILGQVRAAYTEALALRALGPTLSALGGTAIHAGKRVRAEALLNGDNRSIATLAVDRLNREIGHDVPGRVMLVGAGHLARAVFALLSRGDDRQILVLSRQRNHAESLVAGSRHDAFSLDQLAEWLPRCDALIACAAAEAPIITDAMIAPRTGRPLLMLDLGMPRNVDPTVGARADVQLVHLDQMCVPTAPPLDVVERAESIVEQELERFRRWQRARRAAPAIVALLSARSTQSQRSRRITHLRIRDLAEAAA